MTSSDSEEHTQHSRKRSRRSNSGEDGAGGKKARGRPRVDTQDATAADVSGDFLCFCHYPRSMWDLRSEGSVEGCVGARSCRSWTPGVA